MLPSVTAMLRAGVLALVLGGMVSGASAQEGHESITPPRESWSFAGPFGIYDTAQLQRGFKVYREVCSACHSLRMIAFRNLAQPGGPGFTEAEARAIASGFQVGDGPNDAGEMFQRPGRLSDHIPPPVPNEQAARAAFGGALPPDLSLITRARTFERGFPWILIDVVTLYDQEGSDYVHRILTGSVDAPPGTEDHPGLNYNKYFPTLWIAMPKPLEDGRVEYTDGTPATVDQYAKDVAAFLSWAADPNLDARHRIGFEALLFLVVLAGLMYFTKKRVWRNVEGHA
jgi:cytochrome c1